VEDAALVRPEISRDEIEERGLAGTIGANDAGDFVLAKRVIDGVYRRERAKAFGYALRAKDFGVNSRATSAAAAQKARRPSPSR
jgi:hypothetical protein